MRDESLPTLAAAGDMFWLVVWTLWAATSAVFLIWSGYSGYKKSSWWWGISFVGSSIVAASFPEAGVKAGRRAALEVRRGQRE